jgi:hypothetical protein
LVTRIDRIDDLELVDRRARSMPSSWRSRPGVRVKPGASPGDGICAEPHLYVGPWTTDRPRDSEFWNAPFGAMRRASELGADVASEASAFPLDGLRRLR